MEQIAAPAPKKRLTEFGRRARQKRIFVRLREGWAYDEIAREERLTAARVRQIVSEVLQKREVDDSSAHALLQLSCLAAPPQDGAGFTTQSRGRGTPSPDGRACRPPSSGLSGPGGARDRP